MRSLDTNTYAALQAAPEAGLAARDLVYFLARSLDGESTQEFAFWGDLDPTAIEVIDGLTGSTDTHTYVGDGALLSMDRIPLTSDLTVRTVTITLSQIHADVQDMARGYDIRGAQIQVHRLVLDPQTHEPIGTPVCHFVGKVNKAPISTPAVGQEGGIAIDCVSTTRELTRTNPAKKSDETQKRRDGDRLRRWNSPAQVEVWWGQESKTRHNAAQSSPFKTPKILGNLSNLFK